MSKELVAEQDIKNIKSDTYRVHVWGRVDYRDIFRCRRWIAFCHSLNWAKPSGPAFEFCDTYNETDDATVCVTE